MIIKYTTLINEKTATQNEGKITIQLLIIWLAPWAGKVNQIAHCDWLPKRARWSFIAAAASVPEANERGNSLISRRLYYRGLQSLFLTKRKELWLCASGRFRVCSCVPQGIVVMREWEDLGCAAYQSHVQQKVMKFDWHHVE